MNDEINCLTANKENSILFPMDKPFKGFGNNWKVKNKEGKIYFIFQEKI